MRQIVIPNYAVHPYIKIPLSLTCVTATVNGGFCLRNFHKFGYPRESTIPCLEHPDKWALIKPCRTYVSEADVPSSWYVASTFFLSLRLPKFNLLVTDFFFKF